MPYALRIYGITWIHAGDIERSHCSHGCINLPVFSAMRLFEWATPGTPVLIIDNLNEYPAIIAREMSNCTLFASCGKRENAPGKS
jgi:hypothetical protein